MKNMLATIIDTGIKTLTKPGDTSLPPTDRSSRLV